MVAEHSVVGFAVRYRPRSVRRQNIVIGKLDLDKALAAIPFNGNDERNPKRQRENELQYPSLTGRVNGIQRLTTLH